MKSLRSGFALILVLLLALPVLAQEEEEEEEEKWRNFEVAITGGLSMPTGDIKDWKDSLGAETDFHYGILGGYYFTENLISGIYFNFTQYSVDFNQDIGFKLYDLGGYAKYAFTGESNLEPFLKVSGGIIWPKFPTWVSPTQKSLRELSYDPAFSMAGYLGLFYYTSDYGGIYLELGYHNDLLNGSQAIYHSEIHEININSSYLEINVGINVFFGPEE